MKKFKALYHAMNDDLKDAEMMIDYACEIRDEDKDIADELAKYAEYRLEHFMEFHKIFQEEATKAKVNTETMETCLWHETHEMMQDWYYSTERKINKYKNKEG
jgi:hypothetical protein